MMTPEDLMREFLITNDVEYAERSAQTLAWQMASDNQAGASRTVEDVCMAAEGIAGNSLVGQIYQSRVLSHYNAITSGTVHEQPVLSQNFYRELP